MLKHSYGDDPSAEQPRLSVGTQGTTTIKGGSKFALKRSQNSSIVQKNQSMDRRILESSDNKPRGNVSPYKLINPVPNTDNLSGFHSRMSMASKQTTLAQQKSRKEETLVLNDSDAQVARATEAMLRSTSGPRVGEQRIVDQPSLMRNQRVGLGAPTPQNQLVPIIQSQSDGTFEHRNLSQSVTQRIPLHVKHSSASAE